MRVKVVIESPLSGDFERNRRYAYWCAFHCHTLGEAAYASHLIFPYFLDDTIEEHREFGIEAGYSWAQTADLIAFYLDLGESGGMQRARKRWLDKRVEDRRLPEHMFKLFEAGARPAHTPGF